MSDFLFSTAHLYLSDSEQLELFIDRELISPNVELLTQFIVVATLCLLLTLLVKLHLNGNDNFWPDRGIPLLKTSDVSSIFDKLRGLGPKDGDVALYKKLGDRKFGGIMEAQRPVLFVKDLKLATQIGKDFEHFVTTRRNHLMMFGSSSSDDTRFDKMLNNNNNITDQEWQDMRSLLAPLLMEGNNVLKLFFSHFNSAGAQLVSHVREQNSKVSAADPLEGLNVSDCVDRFTMDVIATACFGVESSCLLAKKEESLFYKYGKMFQSLGPWRMAKLFVAFLLPRFATLFRISFAEQEATHFFKKIVEHTINHRQSNEKQQNNNRATPPRAHFLQLLLDARDDGKMKIDEGKKEVDSMEIEGLDDSRPTLITNATTTTPTRNSDGDGGKEKKEASSTKVYLTDDLIFAQTMLFFSAGLDTVSSLLSFATYALAVHPDVQEKLHKEVQAVFEEEEEGNGNLEYDSVNSMTYMDMFINETLRMYPPASRVERRCTKEYQVDDDGDINLVVPKEALVVIPVIAFHHDDQYFPDPQKFYPGRHSRENKSNIPPHSFIPFGYGPRGGCIGSRFALAEVKVAMAHLVRNFIMEPTASTPIPMQFDSFCPFLKPDRMMKIRFRPRK